MRWTAYPDVNVLKLEDGTEDEILALNGYFNKRVKKWYNNKPYYKTIVHFLENRFLHLGLWNELEKVRDINDFELKIDGLETMLQFNVTKQDFTKWVIELFGKHDITPYEFQIDSAYKILKYKRCLTELATGAGKTLVFYIVYRWFLENKMGKILLIVPGVGLATQPIDEFDDYSGGQFPYEISEEFSGSRKLKNAHLVTGTYQTLVKKPTKWFEQFSMISIDETHGANSASIKSILKKCTHCHYRFGQTGTLPKENTVELMSIMSYLGPVVKKVTTEELIQFKRATPLEIKVIQVIHNNQRFSKNLYQAKMAGYGKEVYDLEKKYVVQDKKRIKFLLNLITNIQGASIVAFHRTQYGKDILDGLKKLNPEGRNIYYIDGKVPTENRTVILDSFRSEKNPILVGSYGTIGTGLNIKNAEILFLTESFKSDIIIRQTIGRLIRKFKGKEKVFVFDLVDDLSYSYTNKSTNRKNTWKNKLMDHAKDRQKIYNEQNFPFTTVKYKLK